MIDAFHSYRMVLYVSLLLYSVKSIIYGQLNVANQLQYQIGNLPGYDPSNRSSLYNQLNMNYYSNRVGAGLRIEYFNSDEQGQYYAKIQQKYVQYQNDVLEIQIGNFYESLGHGLLLRSYEIPGVIYEDQGSRQRYGFYKDIEGALIKVNHDHFYLKLLYGNPLDLIQPPERNISNRRPNVIQGGELNLLFSQFISPGFLYLRSAENGEINEFSGLNLSGNLPFGIQYYTEYVLSPAAQDHLLQLGNNGRHVYYGSVSYSYSLASISLEYKDYHDFALNFNDPPSLVREQPRTLLNRGIHVIQPQDERGFQIEGIFNIGELNTITANHSKAVNKYGMVEYNFYEYYLDINYSLTAKTLVKGFLDNAQDEVNNVLNRWTSGLMFEQELPMLWAASVDFQYQNYKREYNTSPEFNHKVKNYFINLTMTHAPDLALGFTLESAYDPLESNTLNQIDRTGYKYWLGYNLNYQYNQNHSFTLFYGRRRGGNACSGGICYEVQPFKGFELRMNSIF